MNARELALFHKFEDEINTWGDGAHKNKRISRKEGIDICGRKDSPRIITSGRALN
jgi:hypothetical protein